MSAQTKHPFENDSNASSSQGTHSSIPESAQYVDASDLIAPSSLIVDGDSAHIHDSTYDQQGSADVSGEIEGMPKAKRPGFDIKKNIPILAGGLVGLVLIGLVGMKMISNGQVDAAPSQLPSVAITEPSPEVAMLQAPKPEVVEVAPILPNVTAPAIMPSVEPAPMPVIATVVSPAAASQLTALESRDLGHDTDIVDLKQRVTKLEAAPVQVAAVKAVSDQATAGQATSANAKAPQRKWSVAQKNAKAARKAENDKRMARRAELSREAKAREAGISVAAKRFSVTAVKDNLVWLRDEQGVISSYSIGERVAGVGRVSRINEVAMTAIIGGRVVR